MRNSSEAGTPEGGEAGFHANTGVMPGLQSAYKEGGRRVSGVIVTSELPPHLMKIMSVFDQDGDGNLDIDEIAEAARVYKAAKDSAKMYKKAAIALFALLCVYTAALGGMIFAIVDANKDSDVIGGVMTDRVTGGATKTNIAATGMDVYALYEKILLGESDEEFLWRLHGAIIPYEMEGGNDVGYRARSPVTSVRHWNDEEDPASLRVFIGFQDGNAVIYKSKHEPLVVDAETHRFDWQTLELQPRKRRLAGNCGNRSLSRRDKRKYMSNTHYHKGEAWCCYDLNWAPYWGWPGYPVAGWCVKESTGGWYTR